MEQPQDRPLISIITVCRNSSSTIGETFDSVLSQAYRQVDYVVIDGESSDGTLGIIKQYEAKFNARGVRFRWLSEPDEGIYDAMNKGIAMAQGDIVGILNSDDFYESHTLRVVSEACSAYPEAGIFYGFLRLLTDSKEIQVYRYRYEHYLLNLEMGIHSAAQHPTCFVRRDVYGQVGTFDTQFAAAADYDFLIRARQAGVRFQPLDAVLCNFRSGGVTDQVTEVERRRQRYGIWYKNGLIGEREYRKRINQLRYKRCRELRTRMVQWLCRL